MKRSVSIIVDIVIYRKTIDIKITKKLPVTIQKLGMGDDKIVKIILAVLSCMKLLKK